MQKSNLSLTSFLRYCKLGILGTLGIHSHTHQNKEYQLKENFDVYLHEKNQLDPSILSWDITLWRILQSDWPRAFWSITWEPEFWQIRGLRWNISNNMIFHFRLFQGKLNMTSFKKYRKKKIKLMSAQFPLKFCFYQVSFFNFDLSIIVPNLKK